MSTHSVYCELMGGGHECTCNARLATTSTHSLASPRRYWVVTQNGQMVCSVGMALTEAQAKNKVENERRRGNFMEARPATDEEMNPVNTFFEDYDDD